MGSLYFTLFYFNKTNRTSTNRKSKNVIETVRYLLLEQKKTVKISLDFSTFHCSFLKQVVSVLNSLLLISTLLLCTTALHTFIFYENVSTKQLV